MQIEQTKALSKLTSEDGLPAKLKQGQEELRAVKERSLKLAQQLRDTERSSQLQQERMVRLEEAVRDLKAQLLAKRANTLATIEPHHREASMLSSLGDEDGARLTELQREARLLQKRTNKDEKLLKMQKKMFDKHVQKLNLEIQNQQQSLKEKDKELRMQALKIKELVYAGTDTHREQIIRRDYQLLQSLASAASPNRHISSTSDISVQNQHKLEQLRQHQLGYGRVLPSAFSALQKSNQLAPLGQQSLASLEQQPPRADLNIHINAMQNASNSNIQIGLPGQPGHSYNTVSIHQTAPDARSKSVEPFSQHAGSLSAGKAGAPPGRRANGPVGANAYGNHEYAALQRQFQVDLES